MSDADETFDDESEGVSCIALAPALERAAFMRKTYGHLAGAIVVFALLEAILQQIPEIEDLVSVMTEGYNWLAVLGAFMAVSYVADRWARSTVSPVWQYVGLSVYVVAEAIIFVPLIYVARNYGGDDVIPTAAIATGTIFVGLSAIVFVSRKDFSFMRAGLWIASGAALALIVAGILFGFELGILFSVGMIVLAGAWVLYHTSNVMHHYHTGQHVAAALALFSAIALLFWYVLRILLEVFGNRD